MKRNTKYLLTVAAAVVILGGALAALKLFGEGEKKDAASASSDVNPISVVEKTSADVVSMQVTNQHGSYTLLPQLSSDNSSSSQTESAASVSGSTSSAGKLEVTYTVQELSGLPVDTTITAQTAENGYNLTALEEIGKVTKLADFGLETPNAKVKIKYQDGSTFQYDIGDVSPTSSSSYYLRANGVVYVADIDPNLLSGKEKFLSTSVLSFSNANNTVPKFYALTMGGTALKTSIAFNNTDDGYAITSPVSAPVDADKAAAITDMLIVLNAESVASAHPDAAALKSYGLDKPVNTLKFTHGGKEYFLLSGAKNGQDRYVMLKGVDVVYKVAESSISSWVNVAKAFDLRSKYILNQDIEKIKGLRFTVGAAQHSYDVTRTKDEKKSTDDKTVYTYTVKKDLTESVDYATTYKTILQNLNGLTLLEEEQKKPVGEPTYRVEYAYFDSSKTNTIEFYTAGNRRYTAVLNGQVCGNVTENDVTALRN